MEFGLRLLGFGVGLVEDIQSGVVQAPALKVV